MEIDDPDVQSFASQSDHDASCAGAEYEWGMPNEDGTPEPSMIP